MNQRRRRVSVPVWGVLVVVLAGVGLPRSTVAEPPSVAFDGPVVRGVDEEGNDWEIHHPVLESDEYFPGRSKPAGPARADGAVFYGLGNTLLRLDPSAGVIRERVHFPARIVGVRPVEGDQAEGNGKGGEVGVEVDLASHDESTEVDPLDVRYRPDGPSPPSGFWSLDAIGLTATGSRDIRDLVRDLDDGDDSTEGEAALRRLEAREARDPYNPYVTYQRAVALDRLDRKEEAKTLLEELASTKPHHWSATFALAAIAAMDGYAETSLHLLDQGIEQLDSVDFRPNWVRAPRLPERLFAPIRQRIDEAVREGRPEDVHAWIDRFQRAFPAVVRSELTWELLAGWFGHQDRPDLQEAWESRAAGGGDHLDFETAEEQYDRWRLTFAGLLLGIALASLGAGVASGRRRSDLDAESAVLRPELTRVEIAGLVLMCTAVVTSLYGMSWYSTERSELHEMPVGLLVGGAPSSPFASSWLRDSPESPARNQWLEYSESRFRAFEAGEPFAAETSPPEWSRLLEVVRDRRRAAFWESFPAFAAHPFSPVYRSQGAPEGPSGPIPTWIVLPTTLGFLVGLGLLLGYVLGRRVPTWARRLQYLVPGAVGRWSTTTSPVAAAVAIPLVGWFTVLETNLRIVAIDRVTDANGLGYLDQYAVTGELDFVFKLLFVAGLGAHLAEVAYDLHTRDD